MGDYEVSDGTNALSYLQEVEKAEPGRLFIDKSGRIVFRSRNNDVNNPTYEYTRLNLCYNPSFENNTTGWISTAGTITRSTAQAYIGTASGQLAAGATAEQYFTSEVGVEYSLSLYARAATGTAVVQVASLTSPSGTAYSEHASTTGTVTNAGWTRIDTTLSATTLFSGISVRQTPSSNAVFLDAVLIEATPLVDAYFDGANDPVYNSTDPEAPDYQPERAFETYETEWVLD
jgi:hypothetical protein